MIREYYTEMGILMDLKVRQLEESTIELDSKRKVLDMVSMMRITKKVWDKMVTSVVSHLVGKDGFSKLVTAKVRVV